MIAAALLLTLYQGPGTHYFVDPKKLPKFGANTSKIIKPIVVSRPAGSTLALPPGFKASVYAKGLKSPRWLLTLPNGEVIVTECYQNRLVLLKPTGKGTATSSVLLTGLNMPFGLAFRDGYLYVANTGSIVRYKFTPGESQITSKREVVLSTIPQRGYNMHWTRNILFSPDGKWLYLSVGSESNRAIEKPPRACLMRLKPDGTGMEVFASGIRNPVGLAFRPGTEELWMTCVERDYMGDDLVPDYLTHVTQGQFYGWPWYYIGKNRDPRTPNPPKKPVAIPDVLFTAHSVPLGTLFYTGTMFPEEYRGDLFVAMRGSTNRRKMAGYQVVRVEFENGLRKPGYESFAEGWIPHRSDPHVYGRPVGLAQLPDGSMLVSDEGANMVWRITYEK